MQNPRTLFFLSLAFLSVVLLIPGCSQESSQNIDYEETLWYEQPANEWEDALPLGNGRIGVMVFGKPSNEHIQLNDDSMWPADKDWDEPDGNKDDLEEIRRLLFEGKNEEADAMFVDKFSRKTVVRSHQTLGDLYMDFDHEDITEYRRELSLRKAVATTSYKSDGQLITQKVFVSAPHQGIIVNLSSEKEGGLNGKIRLNRKEDNGVPTVKVSTNNDLLLIMEGEVTQRNGTFNSMPDPILSGVKFETVLKVQNIDGEVMRGEDYLELKNVKEATLIIVSNSSYYYEDYASQNRKELAQLLAMTLEEIERAHIEDHQQWYDRVQFSLTDRVNDSIPTDKRLKKIRESGETDLGLEALLFQYGRYLLIASSREGTNPANLQGLWNQHINAPWNADYHLNINLQMNYWPANLTGLEELNMPLFDYIDKLVANGKITAEKNFGCRGAFIPHATDLWAPTWLRAPTAYWGCSMGGGGWLMQHYFEHFEFTGDTTFLKERALPAIKEVAMFYSDWLIEDPRDGFLISAPSTSPENRFYNKEGNQVATCLGSAMDQQIIEEVFRNYVKGCKALGIEDEFLDRVKEQLPKLRPGFVLGSDGRILEWDREYEEPEPGHRHMSHLYGFHPGKAISKLGNPEIFEAVRKTLDYRLENGGAGTGWSRAWLINCSARLMEGDMAHEHIKLLFQKSMYDNLFDAHPPFQIDGNFGYTAGLTEMIVQSHEEGMVRILPALPSEWKTGHVKGLKGRNGLTIDISWTNNVLNEVKIHSQFNTSFNLNYRDNIIPVAIKAGENYSYSL